MNIWPINDFFINAFIFTTCGIVVAFIGLLVVSILIALLLLLYCFVRDKILDW